MPAWLSQLSDSPLAKLAALVLTVVSLCALLCRFFLWVTCCYKKCDKENLKKHVQEIAFSEKPIQSRGRKRLIACGEQAIGPITEFLLVTDSKQGIERLCELLCEICMPFLKTLIAMRKEEDLKDHIDGILGTVLPSVVHRMQFNREPVLWWKKPFKQKDTSPGEVVATLIGLLDASDTDISIGAAIALTNLSSISQSEIVQALGRKLYITECDNRALIEESIESLGLIQGYKAVLYLKSGLGHPWMDIRIKACQTLSKIGGPEAMGAIRILLPENEPFEVRESIGGIHERHLFYQRLEEPDVLKAAVEAIGKIGEFEGISILKRVKQNLPALEIYKKVDGLLQNLIGVFQQSTGGAKNETT